MSASFIVSQFLRTYSSAASVQPAPPAFLLRLRRERTGVVPGRLRGDLQTEDAGGTHDADHLARIRRRCHGRRPLVDGKIPGDARLVVSRVVGVDDRDVFESGELAELADGGLVGRNGRDGHDVLLALVVNLTP
mgnify:CR=1 FL=1